MAKLRVAFPFVGDLIGGSHLSTMLLVEGLRGTPYEPVVLVHHTGPLTRELDRQGVAWVKPRGISPFANPLTGSHQRWRPVGPGPQVALTALSLPALRRTLRDLRISIVHTNDARIHRTWGAAARSLDLPHVWHQRNPGLSRRMAALARRADAILAVSHFARKMLPADLAQFTTVLDNPFRPSQAVLQRDQHRRSIAAEFDLPVEQPLIGFVSSFIDRKRPNLFIDMASDLVHRHRLSATFMMVGVDDEAIYERFHPVLARQGLEDTVKLLPFRTPIDPIMAAFDMLVAPSVAEPFARTLVEAMFVGTPVIAVDDGGNRELIDHEVTGLLVPPDDARALGQAVRRLVANPDLSQRIAASGLTTVTGRFSIERHATKVTEIYDGLLRQSPR